MKFLKYLARTRMSLDSLIPSTEQTRDREREFKRQERERQYNFQGRASKLFAYADVGECSRSAGMEESMGGCCCIFHAILMCLRPCRACEHHPGRSKDRATVPPLQWGRSDCRDALIGLRNKPPLSKALHRDLSFPPPGRSPLHLRVRRPPHPVAPYPHRALNDGAITLRLPRSCLLPRWLARQARRTIERVGRSWDTGSYLHT